MSAAERQRLLAIGKAIAQYPDMHVSIEAFADRAGSEPVSSTIALHRARVGQAILTLAGVPEAQIALSTPELDPGARLARTIRITTEPALAPSERP